MFLHLLKLGTVPYRINFYERNILQCFKMFLNSFNLVKEKIPSVENSACS